MKGNVQMARTGMCFMKDFRPRSDFVHRIILLRSRSIFGKTTFSRKTCDENAICLTSTFLFKAELLKFLQQDRSISFLPMNILFLIKQESQTIRHPFDKICRLTKRFEEKSVTGTTRTPCSRKYKAIWCTNSNRNLICWKISWRSLKETWSATKTECKIHTTHSGTFKISVNN